MDSESDDVHSPEQVEQVEEVFEAGGVVPSGIVLAATPIGTLADASPRLIAALQQADIVAAEDTRRLRTLTAGLGVRVAGRIVAHHEHNESRVAGDLVAAAAGGARVLVVTDAGMPSVSDPGLRLVRAAAAAGVPVSVIPGPSAVLTALAVSGLATDRFCFEGFLPRRQGERERALAALAQEPRTMVFFEAPTRLTATLSAMAAAFGRDRAAAICRELTKRFEDVRRGTLGELIDGLDATPVRGEISLVVAGWDRPVVAIDPGDATAMGAPLAKVRALVADGMRLKDAVAVVAPEVGVPKRDLYQAVLNDQGASR